MQIELLFLLIFFSIIFPVISSMYVPDLKKEPFRWPNESENWYNDPCLYVPADSDESDVDVVVPFAVWFRDREQADTPGSGVQSPTPSSPSEPPSVGNAGRTPEDSSEDGEPSASGDGAASG